ncbi:hypothetical protein PQE70_gp164 [Bacillus phage vB_BanS_Nate]|uniref:Uncharacterized protein n=1 Tax=Bacillus phage vB_BanS_Nate TaxID=2894788 RepID=A0AAE9CEJ7_9CAUD|nr:hypothetical protein PQE70_gp164 [Bacillus phage vB_BanS_Nate]UGO51017.1 hypothetical protein NATE_164 [Bacillus phage vB_BanS_Nate]
MHRYTNKPTDMMSHERQLKNVASFYFVEMCSGIYHVEKDREGVYDGWVDLRTVTGALKNKTRVLVKSIDGNMFSNTDLLERIKK